MTEEEGRNNYQKGHDFEKRVADHMTRELGFSQVARNVKLNGKVATEAYEVDILAVKRSYIWTGVWVLALAGLVLGEMAIVAPRLSKPVTVAVTTAGVRVQKTAGLASPMAGVAVLALGMLVVGMVGDRHSRKRIWVECKKRSQTIKRKDLYALDGNVSDVRARAGRRKSRCIDAVWYISTIHYDSNAVAVAREKGIELYFATETSDGMTLQRVY